MQETFPEAMDGKRRAPDTGSIFEAKETLNALALAYYQDGMGGGLSMDNIILATLDLQALGFSEEMCLIVGMQRMKDELEGLILEWEHNKEPSRFNLIRQKVQLHLELVGMTC